MNEDRIKLSILNNCDGFTYRQIIAFLNDINVTINDANQAFCGLLEDEKIHCLGNKYFVAEVR